MKLLYFAWIRSKIGIAQEEIMLPESITTVAELIDWLRNRGHGYADAFAHPDRIRVAINQHFANFGDQITENDEVALFPPVTGG